MNVDAFLFWSQKIPGYEGGYSNDPRDSGGETKFGVTLKDGFKPRCMKLFNDCSKQRFYDMTVKDAEKIMWLYWHECSAHRIEKLAIAFLVAEMYWGSGGYQILYVQRLMNQEFSTNLVTDGVMGPQTIAALQKYDILKVIDLIKRARIISANDDILAHPEKEAFRIGWYNRINSNTKLAVAAANDTAVYVNHYPDIDVPNRGGILAAVKKKVL